MRALAFTLLLAVAAPAAAEGPPRTRYGLLLGARAATGALASRYGIAGVIGVEAGYLPSWIGVVWSLQYARFWSSDPRNVEDLQLIDVDFMLRARLAMRGDLPAFLWAQVGAALVRSSVPIDPGMTTSSYGPAAGLGTEIVWGPFLLSIGADYTLLGDGPSGLRVLVFAGTGGR